MGSLGDHNNGGYTSNNSYKIFTVSANLLIIFTTRAQLRDEFRLSAVFDIFKLTSVFRYQPDGTKTRD